MFPLKNRGHFLLQDQRPVNKRRSVWRCLVAVNCTRYEYSDGLLLYAFSGLRRKSAGIRAGSSNRCGFWSLAGQQKLVWTNTEHNSGMTGPTRLLRSRLLVSPARRGEGWPNRSNKNNSNRCSTMEALSDERALWFGDIRGPTQTT